VPRSFLKYNRALAPEVRFLSAGDYVITVGGGQPGTSAAKSEAHLTIRGEQKLPE
jgi:hypothetical protein